MRKSKSISPFTVIVTVVCLTLIGFTFLPMLPIKLFPSEQMSSISISFGMQNGTSKIVETEVTSRIEATLARMSGVKQITSSSSNGGGYISLTFDKHTDINAARFEISTLIRQIWPELPIGTSYPNIYVNTSNDDEQQPFLVYTINALSNNNEIYNNVVNIFKTGFADLEELSAVDISGGVPNEWILSYDINTLSRLGIDENTITQAIANYRYSNNVSDFLITTGIPDTTFVLSDIYVTLPDSTRMPLDRLVSLNRKQAKQTSIFRINGLNSIYLSFKATNNANLVKLKEKVVQRIEQLKKLMPEKYELHKISDNTERITSELDKIYFRSGLTVLILLIFVFITTFNWRQVLVITFSLICNLAIAVIAYYLLKVELQLYSLAGITISLNLVIDNTIIMSDHWRREHNLTAILPIIAATLTTIGALSIVFFLDERLRLNLYDFAIVIIVNLLISVLIALWFVPAMLKMQKDKSIKKYSYKRLRVAVYLTRFYSHFIIFTTRHRALSIIILILGFGLPFFAMPNEIKSESTGAKIYNTIFGSKVYQESIRPYTDVIFGGALRLFVEKVYNGSYWGRDNDEVNLYIYASMPAGTTLEQMDELIRRMESYLSEFKEIKQFQTSVSPRQARILINFTKEAEHSSFPYVLKSNIISKALQLGGGSWDVYGLQDQGFSNNVSETTGSYQLELLGYNYETLWQFADSIRNHLLTYKRIKDVTINSDFTYYKDDYSEYHISPKKEELAKQNISAQQLFYELNQIFISDRNCGTIWNGEQFENIKLSSNQSEQYNVWSLFNRPIELNNRQYKIGQLCDFEKRNAPYEIKKINQQYRLCIQYDYIGSYFTGEKVINSTDSIYSEKLPLGYTIKNSQRSYSWGESESKQYWLLGLVIAIIIFTTSILFNSLRQPIIIIAIIPISYIGLFLTFYLFELNFDQGGFAALIMLCGITVNASIYIVNEYRKQLKLRKNTTPLKAYLKSFNIKIIPILLTVISTILGFIPFIIGEQEAFWFPLAVGTIGGLIMSLIGIYFFLPSFTLHKKSIQKNIKR